MARVAGHHGLHATLLVRTPQGDDIAIDHKLAPVISLLWWHGFKTRECCQDDLEMTPGRAYIDFVSMPHAVRFIRESAQRAEDANVPDVNLWTFDIRLHDAGYGVRVLFEATAIGSLCRVW